MTKTKYFFIILSIIFIVFLISGCTTPTGEVVKEQEVIKVGFVAPLSGPAAAWGQTEIEAAQMAVNEINNKGGVLGRKLVLVPEDGKCAGKEASTAANKLVNLDKLKVILGGTCSSETLAMAPITEKNKVLLLTGLSSNPQISDAGEYIFRFTGTDEDFFRPQARYAYNELGYRNVAVIIENTDYCLTAKEAFVDEFRKLGGKVSSIQIANPDERDYRTYVTKMKNSGADTVVIIPQTPITGGLMAKHTKQLWPEAPIYGGYTMESSEAIEASEGSLNGAIVFSLSSEISTGKQVLRKYRETYNKEPADNVLPLESWDRVFALKQAIEHCKGLDVECMKNYLYTTEFDLSLGKYSFDQKGDITMFYVGVYKIENDKAIPLVSQKKIIRD